MIDTVIDTINDSVSAIDIDNQEFHGIARLHVLEEEQYPAIYVGHNEWDRISLDDSSDLLLYHRVLGIEEIENDDFDFRGSLDDSVSELFNMIMVVAMKKEYDYDTIISIKNLIPGTSKLSGYTIAFIDRGEIETDEDSIIEEEFGATDYTKYKSDFNIFRIQYTIELNNC